MPNKRYADWLTQHTPMTKQEAAGATATLMPFADRREALVSDAVETITGHSPQRFEDYLDTNLSPDSDR